MVLFSILGRFGPRRRLHGTASTASRRPREDTDASHATPGRPSTRDAIAAITRLPTAGRQGQQVADDLATFKRGLALLEGEHPLEGARVTGADREHDFEIRESQSRLVVRSPRFEV